MEIVLYITLILIVSTLFLKELSELLHNIFNFIKYSNINKSKDLLNDEKTITFSLTVDSRNKKETCAANTSLIDKRLD